MDAFLIPGGFGTRQEIHNGRLHEYIRALPDDAAHQRVHRIVDLRRDGPARRPGRHQPQGAGPSGAGRAGKVPIDRLAEIAPACRISRARVVDAGRIVTAGGIASGMEMGFHLLQRAGYDDESIAEVARVMEYSAATRRTRTTANRRPRPDPLRGRAANRRLIVAGAGGDPESDRLDLVRRERLVRAACVRRRAGSGW